MRSFRTNALVLWQRYLWAKRQRRLDPGLCPSAILEVAEFAEGKMLPSLVRIPRNDLKALEVEKFINFKVLHRCFYITKVLSFPRWLVSCRLAWNKQQGKANLSGSLLLLKLVWNDDMVARVFYRKTQALLYSELIIKHSCLSVPDGQTIGKK